MTKERAIDLCKAIDIYLCIGNPIWDVEEIHDAMSMAIEALGFTDWVAKEIFSEDMDDAFAELACRRLEKLGVVKADGNEWVLKVGEEE